MIDGSRGAGGAQTAGGEATGGFSVAVRGVTVDRGVERAWLFAGGGTGEAELQQRVKRGRGRIVVGGAGGEVCIGNRGPVDEVESPSSSSMSRSARSPSTKSARSAKEMGTLLLSERPRSSRACSSRRVKAALSESMRAGRCQTRSGPGFISQPIHVRSLRRPKTTGSMCTRSGIHFPA